LLLTFDFIVLSVGVVWITWINDLAVYLTHLHPDYHPNQAILVDVTVLYSRSLQPRFETVKLFGALAGIERGASHIN
jgi:hypothetical protein